MNILFDKDICLFKYKSNKQIIKKFPEYKKYYNPIFLKFIDELEFDTKYIDKIHIISQKSSYATTIPSISDNQISFTIELSDDIIPYISDSQNSLETFKAKSVFQHEICHCIEIKQLYQSNTLKTPNPICGNFPINNTYNFLYDESVKIWSEFFACYHNRTINEWHECPNVKDDLDQLNKWILATQYMFNDKNDVQLCEKMLKFLHTFWYHMVSLIAVHIHNHEDLLIEDYKNTQYTYIPEYFDYIYQHFKINLEYYPSWLSEDNYIELGKALIKILELNGIVFSTDDLSDCFIFKPSK